MVAADAAIDVRWTGFVPHSAMPAIYQASDVVCVPSVWDEPFGMVVLEALACGAAVVASPRGGLREAGGDAAVYIEPSDELHVACSIAALANDAVHLRSLQIRGTEHALRNSWTARYRQLAEAVDAFAAGTAPIVS
jgi:glycosyltransferase involved in cell wall biosynthesis